MFFTCFGDFILVWCSNVIPSTWHTPWAVLRWSLTEPALILSLATLDNSNNNNNKTNFLVEKTREKCPGKKHQYLNQRGIRESLASLWTELTLASGSSGHSSSVKKRIFEVALKKKMVVYVEWISFALI